MKQPTAQENNPERPSALAGAHGSATEIIEELIRACGSGMNWMDQVSRAKLGSATRGILTTDIGMCSSAIFKARQYLEKAKSPNSELRQAASEASDCKPDSMRPL